MAAPDRLKFTAKCAVWQERHRFTETLVSRNVKTIELTLPPGTSRLPCN